MNKFDNLANARKTYFCPLLRNGEKFAEILLKYGVKPRSSIKFRVLNFLKIY